MKHEEVAKWREEWRKQSLKKRIGTVAVALLVVVGFLGYSGLKAWVTGFFGESGKNAGGTPSTDERLSSPKETPKIVKAVPAPVGDELGLQLALVPPGEFIQGSPITEVGRIPVEEDLRNESVKALRISVTEISEELFNQVMPDESRKELWGPRFPVVGVTARDAEDFCARLTILHSTERRIPDGWRYRLPTEAEWEYCCRAGSRSAFSFGGNPGRNEDHLWSGGRKRPRACHLGQENKFGLKNMHGNVWEWCSGMYDDGVRRVLRGGSFQSGFDKCRSANRYPVDPNHYGGSIGFRIVLAPP